jgi:hypothetical protein
MVRKVTLYKSLKDLVFRKVLMISFHQSCLVLLRFLASVSICKSEEICMGKTLAEVPDSQLTLY